MDGSNAVAAVTPLSQSLAWIAIVAAGISVLSLLALHALKPELAPSWRMISEYALGPHGWLMVFGVFVPLSLACASLVVALLQTSPSIVTWIGMVLLLVTGVALLIAAANPTDPATVAPADMSPTGRIHGMAVLLGNPPFVLASLLILIGTWGAALWEPVRLPLLILTVIVWIAFLALVAMFVILVPRSGFGPAVPVGWPNRALVLAYAGWIIAAAWPLAVGRAG